VIEIGIIIAIYLAAIVVHEVSHGLVALAFGDTTALRAGRLSANPLRHVDVFWTLIFPAILFFATGGRFIFGMAKPVPVDFSRLRDPKRNMVWVALAGPASNLLLAGALTFFYKLTGSDLLLMVIYLNLGLAVFNMIPIPPLDGSRVLAGLLPVVLARALLRLEPYGFLIVLALYFSRALSAAVVPVMNLFCRLMTIPELPGIF